MPMSREDKSFWSGACHGLLDGAFRGFIIGGLIAIGLLVAAGLIGTMISTGTLGGLGIGFGSVITAFIGGGAIGAVVGSPITCAYEGINEYIEEKEVQRDCTRAHQLGYIENYKLNTPSVDKKTKKTVSFESENHPANNRTDSHLLPPSASAQERVNRRIVETAGKERGR